MIAASAAEAFDRYSAALSADALTQGSWHLEKDGRQLACGLGVIGDEIGSAADCPARIMPRWLAQMVPWFFDNQSPADALPWGLAFYAELKRLDGNVPFSVVHDWHVNFTAPLAIEVSGKRGRKPEVHRALQELHRKALAGANASYDDWYAALKPAFLDATANAYANTYATANADTYATANAYADADADAYAYAYTYTYAYTYVTANAYAYAYADAYVDADAYRSRIKALADGMVDCLRRVESGT